MHLGPLLLMALLAFPLAAHAGQAGELVAAAAAAGRPPECSARSGRAIARGPTVWERARAPELPRYCDLLARGQAQLGGDAAAARESARLADKILPGHAAPQVLLARADLALGSPEDAARAFEQARRIDPRSVEDPQTMHDLARALARTGKRDEAMATYRALVPRIDLLGTADQRALVLLEAAHLSMAAAGAASPAGAAARPPAGAHGDAALRGDLDEAIAYLREARLRAQTQLARDVTLSLALALDRAGDKAQADAALEGEAAVVEAGRLRVDREAARGEAARGRADDRHAGAAARAHAADDLASAAARLRTVEYLAVPEDRLALEALALERTVSEAAIARWEAYLSGAGGQGPWAPAARARLDALRRGALGGGHRPARGGTGAAARAPRERGAAQPPRATTGGAR
ncbi:tetratricopeptide repeat protein [Sorangium sp. So ce375]|uniref:tetratricopeptide repeat protein n=1 Tax=Sorangium sp. So ce375 TaxID=3133306 RepID=UPI003F5B6734